MNKKALSVFLLLAALFVFGLLVACQPGPWIVTVTPVSSSTLAATPVLITPTPSCVWPCESDSLTLTAARAIDYTLTAAAGSPTPTCVWPCASDSLTMTAAMGATLAAIPTNTPPPWATIYPSAGDLGWGPVYGRIIDGLTFSPIAGATVKCEQFSYSSPYPCNAVTTTNDDGVYSFPAVFFHDTDRIVLSIEASGYNPLRFEQAFFTFPELHADLGLFPGSAEGTFTPTPTFFPVCTAPACDSGALTCGDPNGCPGGCGTICATFTPTP